MSAPRQLALDLPYRQASGRQDFLVSQSNRQAVEMIDAWPHWPYAELVLIGPEGSGKSHLVEVWRARSGAARIAADALHAEAVPALSDNAAIVVEDCGSGVEETALFYLLNEIGRRRGHLLMTARTAPSGWGLALPDLSSRLNRMAVVRLDPPDDALMEAVLVKLFADRQLDVTPELVRYLAARIERSFAAMREAVARLDRMAIEEQRKVTRALAARMLAGTLGERD